MRIMKSYKYIGIWLIALTCLLFSACSSDDDNNDRIATEIEQIDATHIKAEGIIYVFKKDHFEVSSYVKKEIEENAKRSLFSKIRFKEKDYEVTTICRSALNNCVNLSSIYLPNTITKIDSFAFYSCRNLRQCNLPKNLQYLRDGVFTQCNIQVVTVPARVKKIEQHAYSYNEALTSVNIADSVESIGYASFGYCPNITSIKMPSSLNYIGKFAFESCYRLQKIEIPENVTSLPYCCFRYCFNLKEATLPAKLKEINAEAFGQCTSLKTIHFKGTKQQWKSISKTGNWNQSCSKELVIECSDGTI